MKVIVGLPFIFLFVGMDPTKKSPKRFWPDRLLKIFTVYQKIRPWTPILTAEIRLILANLNIELGNCFNISDLLMSVRAHFHIITIQFKKFHVKRLKNVTMPKFEINWEAQY